MSCATLPRKYTTIFDCRVFVYCLPFTVQSRTSTTSAFSLTLFIFIVCAVSLSAFVVDRARVTAEDCRVLEDLLNKMAGRSRGRNNNGRYLYSNPREYIVQIYGLRCAVA